MGRGRPHGWTKTDENKIEQGRAAATHANCLLPDQGFYCPVRNLPFLPGEGIQGRVSLLRRSSADSIYFHSRLQRSLGPELKTTQPLRAGQAATLAGK